MLAKLLIVNFLLVIFYQTALGAPLELVNIEDDTESADDDESVDDVVLEIKELKRITRQCPFSGGIDTMFGGGANGQGPDVQQILQIARAVMSVLNGGGLGAPDGGAGGTFGAPGVEIDNNQLSRMRRMRQNRQYG